MNALFDIHVFFVISSFGAVDVTRLNGKKIRRQNWNVYRDEDREYKSVHIDKDKEKIQWPKRFFGEIAKFNSSFFPSLLNVREFTANDDEKSTSNDLARIKPNAQQSNYQ